MADLDPIALLPISPDFSILIDAGTIAFAISGALAGIQKRLDPFGVLVVAFVTAIGGGTLRDVLLGDTPVRWMRDSHGPVLILGSTCLTLLLTRYFKRLAMPLLVFDSLGLGFFTVIGLQRGAAYGLNPGVCIALGTITGCFGGVIRDVILNDVPIIFRKEIYATACIVGGILHYMLEAVTPLPPVADFLTTVFIFGFRLLVVRFGWRLPRWY